MTSFATKLALTAVAALTLASTAGAGSTHAAGLNTSVHDSSPTRARIIWAS